MNKLSLIEVEKAIRSIPDFPRVGINFKDLTTAFKSPSVFKYIVDTLYDHYKDCNITKVVGVESRGFIIGAALAYKLNAGFVLVRKPGKLPADTYSQTYSLEYGEDTLEIHKDALVEDDVVLLHDDLLATGGTALAALDLISKCGVKTKFVNFICELAFLGGAARFGDAEVYSLIVFNE